MKGIVLAGGKGTRLHPLTQAVSKQLMPIYDKPMIYYPISTLIAAGIHEILIISTPQDLPLFERLLGDGSAWGCQFQYTEQAQPNGLAEALILGEAFIDQSPAALILGDNLFYGQNFTPFVQAMHQADGAAIFAYRVNNPSRYGVVTFDDQNKGTSLEEKPEQPRSSFAVPGIYFYDATAVEKAKKLVPSSRGEIEITDLNKNYLSERTLKVHPLNQGATWLDTGTIDSLLEASQFVQALQSRQGVLVGSPELAAYQSKAIDKNQLTDLAKRSAASTYGQALKRFLQQ